MTTTTAEIKLYDEWFDLVGLSKEWRAIKEQFPDNEKQQLMWARIMELNRISETTEKAQNTN